MGGAPCNASLASPDALVWVSPHPPSCAERRGSWHEARDASVAHHMQALLDRLEPSFREQTLAQANFEAVVAATPTPELFDQDVQLVLQKVCAAGHLQIVWGR